MKLRKPCEHGQYDAHPTQWPRPNTNACPGGVFLPDDTLIIEKENGEWKLPFELGLFGPDGAPVNVQEMFDALSVREADDLGRSALGHLGSSENIKVIREAE